MIFSRKSDRLINWSLLPAETCWSPVCVFMQKKKKKSLDAHTFLPWLVITNMHVAWCLHPCVCVSVLVCTCVPLGPVCPLLVACWLYSAWLVIKPFHCGNFHTAVNHVRWLKAAQFVSSPTAILPHWSFSGPWSESWTQQASLTGIRQDPLAALLFLSPHSCQRVFHAHVSNPITAKISCHV